ncbi:hypothetical protein [Rhizobium leguminosarum]|uniref:nSTAND3 domain-containing NTPase n=1 Tax=Rhizobium leguminosarum TaxID=384 RepID=UPI001C982668|nr:hypothetical protein [Rhizobium leguminosarum]MBY5379342.1 hypothetical protein [Rhizobium leguminosarum]
MNIAIIAPTKFDFQDLACVELGLRWPADGAPTLRAEPQNGEDAELTWEEGGRRRLCEVQVKGRSTAEIDMATLAEYLAHFPDYQARGCLLERLISNPEQIVLFVASERCRDDVAGYRIPTTWTGAYRTDPPHRQAGQALAAALKHLSEEPVRVRKRIPTQLELDRAAQLAMLSRTDASRLAEALGRVFIHEEETAATIAVRLHQILFDVGVPSDRLFDGIARLKQVVADDRAARPDVFATLREVLAEFAPEQLARPKYMLRGHENALAADLAGERAILLSGPPRVGKSWSALQLAGGLQKLGYEVARSKHIDQADRFLNDPVRKPRAYVLEDPLGDRQAVKDASTRVSDLRRLLLSLGTDRRLIVAQTEAPILQTFRQNNLRDCALGQFAWRVLEPLSVEQAEALWRRDAAEAGVAREEIERIADVVRERADLRDAGALAYLAITFDRLRVGASANEIVTQGRGDAVDFAQALADESAAVGAVLRGLAVSTETATGIGETELAFVTSASDERPSLNRINGVVVFGVDPPTVEPAYIAAPLLNAALTDAMTALRRRRVLDNQSNRFNFVHPYFRAGAQAMFRPDLEEDLDVAVAFAERALAAVDPKVSLAASRNLDWIASALATREGGLVRAVTLAKAGLHSRYPATRDACFDFLTSRASDFTPEGPEEVRHWVRAVDVDLDDVEEVAGLLVISRRGSLHGPGLIPQVRVQPYVNAIEANQPVDLDPALAYAILLAHRQNGADLTPKMMERLLSMDAAVLRAAASADWLKRPRDGDVEILDRIGNDATPAVSNAVLDVLVRSWLDLSEFRREAIISILAAHAISPGPATTLLERLARFNRVEEFGKEPPWPVFSRLAPIALQHAPDVVFRDGRIVSAIQEAIEAGEGERLIPLLDVWATHLAGRLAAHLPDEFELSVPEAMLDVGQPAWRWPLIKDLLDVANTGARVRIIATLIDRWTDLSSNECRAVIVLLQKDETDADWLRAAALTRDEVPHEVLAALAGRDDLLDLAAPDLLATLGEPLYCACLHVFIGAPQPLWWLGSHHATAQAWTNAVRWSAAAVDRPVFALALEDRIAFSKDEGWLADLVDQYQTDDLPTVFETFLRCKVRENGNWRTLAWNRLLDRGATVGLIDDWVAKISTAAPLFLDHLRDVRLWLGRGPHERRLLESLASDLKAYEVIANSSEAINVLLSIDINRFADGDKGIDVGPSTGQLAAKLLEVLQLVLEQNPPRLFQTWDDVAAKFGTLPASDAIVEWVEAQRLSALDVRQRTRKAQIVVEDQSMLVGWQGPR